MNAPRLRSVRTRMQLIEDALPLTAARLRELFDYDKNTGVFTRRVDRARCKAGTPAGGLERNGYVVIRIEGRLYRAHRLVWLWMYGRWPRDQVDHIDFDRTNNRRCNLRECSNGENQQNKKTALRSNQCGLLGVSPDRGRWRATITVDGKKRHLGSFSNKHAAHRAYLHAKDQLHPFSHEY